MSTETSARPIEAPRKGEEEMSELFPILSGLIVGALLGGIRPATRVPLAAILAIVIGTVATVVSGEYRIGWEYLLIDIPLVAVSSALGLVGARKIRWHAAPND
jgi:hypothetical protein